MNEEARPTLAQLPGIDLDAHCRTLIERFANPEVKDTLARLCAETSDRIPKFLIPVAHAQLKTDGELRRTAAVVASWARYAEGVDEQGETIDVVDPLKDELMERASRQREEPTAFLDNRELFGDLVDQPRFRDAYLAALKSLHDNGARATLEMLVADAKYFCFGRGPPNLLPRPAPAQLQTRDSQPLVALFLCLMPRLSSHQRNGPQSRQHDDDADPLGDGRSLAQPEHPEHHAQRDRQLTHRNDEADLRRQRHGNQHQPIGRHHHHAGQHHAAPLPPP
jgi:hypothetical protein